MANKNLFKSKTVPAVHLVPTNTVNNAGGVAYAMTDKHALAQIAATNCFNGTFYVSAEDNLAVAKKAVLACQSDAKFLAKVALYSRRKAYMKDMPAFIMVALAASGNNELFRKVFPVVIDNGKMLRNFVQIARSGVIGRKFNLSAGSVRHAIQDWFNKRTPEQLFKDSIGNDPSMKDILRMARPKPNSKIKEALFCYMLGGTVDTDKGTITLERKGDFKNVVHSFSNLPEVVQEYELYKKNKVGKVPNVDFRMLDSLDIGEKEWTEIARNASWQMTRMNLNTFSRHGVFKDSTVTGLVKSRLSNAELVSKARAFPYQLLMAYLATKENDQVPKGVSESIQDAMELAIDNVPSFDREVAVCVDTSGSMGSPITGTRVGSTSKVTCVMVASLVASAILRRNKEADIVPFDTQVHKSNLNPRDSVITNTQKLAAFGGGGTNCASALEHLNSKKSKAKTVIFVSDNESWVNSRQYYGSGATGMLSAWAGYKARVKDARLVCIDLTPNTTSQVTEHQDILQVGGFSDAVFDVIANFSKHGNSKDHWVSEIEAIDIDAACLGRGAPATSVDEPVEVTAD